MRSSRPICCSRKILLLTSCKGIRFRILLTQRKVLKEKFLTWKSNKVKTKWTKKKTNLRREKKYQALTWCKTWAWTALLNQTNPAPARTKTRWCDCIMKRTDCFHNCEQGTKARAFCWNKPRKKFKFKMKNLEIWLRRLVSASIFLSKNDKASKT